MSTLDYKKLAGYVRSTRKELGLSAFALGEALGVSQSTVTRLEAAQNSPSGELLVKVLAWLGKPLEEFTLQPDKGE